MHSDNATPTFANIKDLPGSIASVVYGKDADNWRMALEACQTDESMDTRDNPQLFLPTNPERDPEAEPVWLESPVYIPGCEHCGDLKTVCAGVGSVQSPYLPKPTADVTYRSVVSTVCRSVQTLPCCTFPLAPLFTHYVLAKVVGEECH